VGQTLTVEMALPNDKTRYFSGYVTEFADAGTAGRFVRYKARLRPWLWFLTRTADCRIFPDKNKKSALTTTEIIRPDFAVVPARGRCSRIVLGSSLLYLVAIFLMRNPTPDRSSRPSLKFFPTTFGIEISSPRSWTYTTPNIPTRNVIASVRTKISLPIAETPLFITPITFQFPVGN